MPRTLIAPVRLAAALVTLLAAVGCYDQSTQPEVSERVLGRLGRISPGGSFTNPTFTRTGPTSFRMTAWTVHECPMERPDADISGEGDQRTVILWEIRSHCGGDPQPREGIHEYDFEFAGGGEVRIRLEHLGALGVERDDIRLQLDSVDG